MTTAVYSVLEHQGGWGVTCNGRLIYWTDRRRDAEGFVQRLVGGDGPDGADASEIDPAPHQPNAR